MRERLRGLLRGRSRADAAAAPPGHAMLELARRGPAPLRASEDAITSLSVAVVIPSFRRGSGGHGTIVRLLLGLAGRGHRVSIWLEDNEGRHAREDATLTRRAFGEFFGAGGLELQTDYSAWEGADVVLATGWQTVARTLLLEGAGARAYLVQDHEPEFYGTSAEALWASESYRMGLRCIAASAWLAALLRDRYGARATHFDLAPDHAIYRPDDASRREDLVVFYARSATARRAVPLGLLALEELARRRPRTQIALFGEAAPVGASFPHDDLGVLPPPRLAQLYARAQAGVVLSMTNPSLVGLEMMACGLPCVELASESMLASFGTDGPLALAAPDPLALCDAVEHLLDDDAARERARTAGLALCAARSWDTAAAQVEEGLRAALLDARADAGAGRHGASPRTVAAAPGIPAPGPDGPA